MLIPLLGSVAWALCAVSQTPRDDGVDVVIEAREAPIGCRDVTLRASTPVEVEAHLLTADGRRRRLRGEHLVPIPAGGVVVSVPELAVGDRLDLHVAVGGNDLIVALGALPPDLPRGTVIDEVHTFQLDARHPAWGFADPKKGRTHVEAHVRVGPDVPEQALPLPVGSTVIDAGGLRVGRDVLLAPPGTDTTIRYTVPGATALGRRWIGPGSLTLSCPACTGVVATGSEGVTVEGTRFTAPAGGEVRWRVGGTVDGSEVVPSEERLLAGLEWRFATRSLPEPAVPMRLKGMKDRRALLEALYDEVWGLEDAALAGQGVLWPRQLNRAWRSGWATDVERGLILQRMLAQERFPARVVITGHDPDPVTWTGLEVVLVLTEIDGAPLWLDPSCAVCAPGQVSTRWMGQWAVGADHEVPRAPGELVRSTRVEGERVTVRFRAEKAAARWIREALVDTDASNRDARLATLLGMRGARVLSAEGLDADAGEIQVVLEGSAPPRDPFEGRPPPWAGGILDRLDAAGDTQP